jgi:hypothetical protein
MVINHNCIVHNALTCFGKVIDLKNKVSQKNIVDI